MATSSAAMPTDSVGTSAIPPVPPNASGLGQNSVFLDSDGILHNVFVGPQTYDSVKSVERANAPHIAALLAADRRVRIVVDLQALGASTTGSRRASAEVLTTQRYDYMALFGASRMMRLLAELIVRASGRGNRVRYFGSEAEARAWLLAQP